MKARLFKGDALRPGHVTEPVRHDDLRNYRIEWEILTDFRVTDSALDQLRDSGLAEDAIQALATLKRSDLITGKRELLALLVSQLKRVVTEEEKELIWKLTKVQNENEPDAYFEQNGSDLLTTRTPSHGESQVTLRQVLPKEGHNRIRMRLKLPDKLPDGLDKVCCPRPSDFIYEKTITKTWEIPRITIRKSCEPNKVALQDTVRFDVTVENASQFPVTSVVVTDKIPSGFLFQEAGSEQGKMVQSPKHNEVDGTVVCGTCNRFRLKVKGRFGSS